VPGPQSGHGGGKECGPAADRWHGDHFHDSDDISDRDKVLRQVRVLTRTDVRADDSLNWPMIGHTPSAALEVSAVLTHYALILPDGRRVEIRRTLSLVDDLFPNLQIGSDVPGDWTHINSGLFRAAVFQRLGGFAPRIEEDREFRNRLILGRGDRDNPRPAADQDRDARQPDPINRVRL